jgi:hypothetical protein
MRSWEGKNEELGGRDGKDIVGGGGGGWKLMLKSGGGGEGGRFLLRGPRRGLSITDCLEQKTAALPTISPVEQSQRKSSTLLFLIISKQKNEGFLLSSLYL